MLADQPFLGFLSSIIAKERFKECCCICFVEIGRVTSTLLRTSRAVEIENSSRNKQLSSGDGELAVKDS